MTVELRVMLCAVKSSQFSEPFLPRSTFPRPSPSSFTPFRYSTGIGFCAV